jgi:hypothetical protein
MIPIEDCDTQGNWHDIHEAPGDVWVCVVCGLEFEVEPDFEYVTT